MSAEVDTGAPTWFAALDRERARARAAEARAAVAEAQRDTLAGAAGTFARDFLSWVENEAPADWDGGDLGYTMGGFASMAQEILDALAAVASGSKPEADEASAVAPTEAKP